MKGKELCGGGGGIMGVEPSRVREIGQMTKESQQTKKTSFKIKIQTPLRKEEARK
jgi:hypothetical protein